MIRERLVRNAAAVAVAVALAAASLAAAGFNGAAGPPRALFLRLAPDAPVPELTVSARRDPARGWLLELGATHFRFTATCLPSAEPVPIGHAHVTRGDVKVASAFAPEVALGALEPGRHSYRVVLRGQDHRVLLGPDGPISAEIVIEESALPQA